MFAWLTASTLGLAALSPAQSPAQGLTSSPHPRAPQSAVRPSTQNGTANCNVIDFEGLGDLTPIGTIPGSPDVTFGSSWLGLVDADSGGTGNFANEPSANTVAFFLAPADPIDFGSGVQSIEIHYVASGDSVPVTLTAYDGPGGTGNVVDTTTGATVGTNFDGAACGGDPSGQFCLFDVMTLTAPTNNIRSIVLTGAVANQFAFDNMTFCGSPPVTFYCTAKVNSQGCTPAMFSSGAPSASSATVFTLGANDVLNNKFALLVYGPAAQNQPFMGGTLCVANLVKRLPGITSGGNPPPSDCSGVLAVDFNAQIQGGTDPTLVPGANVFAQYFYRDPADAFRWGLTDAAEFVINP